MELTRKCLEEIATAAREAGDGILTITVQSRPEDKKFFELRLAYDKRIRVGKPEPTRGEPVDRRGSGRYG
jgi:hypothetical protein